MAWAESLPQGAAHDGAVSAAVNSWATTEPQSAWQYAQGLPDSADTNKLLLSVATTWSRSDPAGAAQAVISVPDSIDVTGPAIRSVVLSWENSNDGAAKGWANSLPDGPQRDVAISAIAVRQTVAHPDNGMVWAAKIADESVRVSTIGQVISNWSRTNPDAAAAALDAAPLTDQERANIQNNLNNAPQRPLAGGSSTMQSVTNADGTRSITITGPDGSTRTLTSGPSGTVITGP